MIIWRHRAATPPGHRHQVPVDAERDMQLRFSETSSFFG
jgi:hypothetical protein